MTESKLKPCPFCGGEAEFIYKFLSPHDMDNKMLVRVRCKECFAQSPYKANPKYHGWFDAINKRKAAYAWNRRVTDD